LHALERDTAASFLVEPGSQSSSCVHLGLRQRLELARAHPRARRADASVPRRCARRGRDRVRSCGFVRRSAGGRRRRVLGRFFHLRPQLRLLGGVPDGPADRHPRGVNESSCRR